MLLLVLCILINAAVVSIIKGFEKYDVDSFQAIVFNYFVCVLTAGSVLGDLSYIGTLPQQSWIYHAVFLSVALMTTFNFIAKAIQAKGIVITSIFQKMSLILVSVIAIAYYQESLNLLKVIGLVLAVTSIFVITSGKVMPDSDDEIHRGSWLFPILVLVGSSIIDVSFLVFEKEKIVPDADIRFVASLFFSAGIMGLAILVYQIVTGKSQFAWKNVIAGIVLGIPNFFSIYWLVLLLSKGWDGSIVFPANNVGILAMSAVFGFIFFKEQIRGRKLVGLILAIIAIVILALSN